MTPKRFRLFATAGFGLESVVARELSALGYAGAGVGSRPGWVTFEAGPEGLARANVFLRSADRVLLAVGSFPAKDFGELFERTRAIAWERFLPRDAAFAIKGRSVKSQLSSVPACQRIVKKAIVERLRSAYRVTSIPETGATFGVEVSLLADEAQLTLDTSGIALHRRGYRPQVGRAPLKETLAAALVLLSFWKRGRPFLDPFCGSGTIAIEAALIARNLAPGRQRVFAAESWPFVPSAVWQRAREEARDTERRLDGARLMASDRDLNELAIARESAERAGVAEDVRFEAHRFEDLPGSSEGQGCIITNPPYGDRMGSERETRELYLVMPEVFRRYPKWSFFVLTSRRDLERGFGQIADRRRKLYNGPTQCTYFQFHGPRAHEGVGEPEADGPVFGGLSEKGRRQTEIFSNRLKKRDRHLARWARRNGIVAYRVYDADIKEVPLTVDRYEDAVLLRPPPGRLTQRSRAEEADWLDAMAKAAATTLDVDETRVVRRTLHQDVVLSVLESGLEFEVRLRSESNETGLPIPERSLRTRVRTLSRGKRVLIPYARSGALTVAADAGGARSTTSIDLSVERLDWARRNFALNAVDTSSNALVHADVNDYLGRRADSYDLIVIVLARSSKDGERATLFRQLPHLCASQATVLVVSSDPRLRLKRSDVPDFEIIEITETLLSEDVKKKRRRAFRLRLIEGLEGRVVE